MKNEENVVQMKSYEFAIRIVRVYKYLVEEKKEFALSKQLLRCGTSIPCCIYLTRLRGTVADHRNHYQNDERKTSR